MGLFRAIIEAILGGADDLAGQSITELTAPLSETETGTMEVQSTIRFGENVDGTDDALLLVNGEVIYATDRRSDYLAFSSLERGYDTTRARAHPTGSLVFDISWNRTARDLVRRAFFVRTARLEDLDVIGRNLGLHKCPGLDEETWRSLIQVMAYLPNQPVDAFKKILDVYPGSGSYRLVERINRPNEVFIELDLTAFSGSGLRGKFFLNGGTRATADGTGTQVTVPHDVNLVLGVFDDNEFTRRGERSGYTNYYEPGGSFVGPTITLGTPVAPGAALIVDYGAFTAHYLAEDETIRYPADGDFFPYLSDPSATIRCLLEQTKASGVRVNVTTTVF